MYTYYTTHVHVALFLGPSIPSFSMLYAVYVVIIFIFYECVNCRVGRVVLVYQARTFSPDPVVRQKRV